jgi:hypothetical protein
LISQTTLIPAAPGPPEVLGCAFLAEGSHL